MLRLVVALVLQVVIFSVYYYLDARMMVGNLRTLVNVGLHPLTILFYGLTALPTWWAYREVYLALGSRFWYAIMVEAVLFQTVYIIASYIAVRQAPTTWEWVAIGLSILAAIVSGIK